MLAVNWSTPFALLSSSSFARRASNAFSYTKNAPVLPTIAILKYGKRIRQELAHGPYSVRRLETNCIRKNPSEEVLDASQRRLEAVRSRTYVLTIRRRFLGRTYRIALVALCACMSWEFVFSFLYPHGPVKAPVNIV